MSNSIIPELLVSDIKVSLHFYTSVVGFEIDYERSESKFAKLDFEGCKLMIQERNGYWETGIFEYPFGRGINLEIKVSDISKILQRLEGHKYELFEKVTDSWYRKGDVEVGRREFLILDPDGYLLRFSQDIGERAISK